MSRKEQILDVLIDSFLVKGFSTDFSLSELAENVGIGKSTLYEYFSNKDEILKEAVIKYVKASIDKVTMLEGIGDLGFENAFKKQMKVLLETASESRTILETLSPNFVQKLPDSMRDEMKAKMEEIRQLIQLKFMELFISGAKEGLFKGELNPRKGTIVTSLVVGTLFTLSDPRSKVNTDEAIEDVYDTVLQILN